MFPKALLDDGQHLVDLCTSRQLKIATAESCTGGLIGGLLTAIPGSSKVFDRGFITYSNAAKRDVLNVPRDLLRQHGAVSEEVARAMAQGALSISGTDIAVAVTGIAGPAGGGPDKPVGLVHFGTAHKSDGIGAHVERYGDLGREDVRLQTVHTALKLLMALAGK